MPRQVGLLQQLRPLAPRLDRPLVPVQLLTQAVGCRVEGDVLRGYRAIVLPAVQLVPNDELGEIILPPHRAVDVRHGARLAKLLHICP